MSQFDPNDIRCGPFVPPVNPGDLIYTDIPGWGRLSSRWPFEVMAFLPRWGEQPLEGMTPNLSVPGIWETVTERLRLMGVWWPGE